jgi:uncharacterized protein involved in type VI secretion and phage assembly
MSQITASLMDRIDTRFYGKHRAFVADHADPENRGRLRLNIPDVLGNDVVSGWALPCAPYGGTAGQGFFFIPENKAGVWVEFEQGLLDYPVWVGTFWAKPGGTTEVPPPGDSQSPPTSKIIKTLKHTIELADDDGSEAIIVTDTTNKNKVTMDQNGITVEDQNSNKIELSASGVKIQADKDIELKASGGVKIQASKDIELKADGDLKITATNVKMQVSSAVDIS